MSILTTYLEELQRIRASGLGTTERSYYPALAALLRALGERLSPRVTAIHDIKDRGVGHPDFALEVENTHDLRAAIEAKGAAADLDTLIRSEQVRRYLTQHDPTLVTNLRQFALVGRGQDGQPTVIMHYSLADDAETLWRTPAHTLAAQHESGLTDMLLSALTWDATISRPRDLAEALARYAREALRRLERHSAETLASLRTALGEALGLQFTDEQGEHFFRSSLVQTLFYGLFSAWVVWQRTRPNAPADAFRWREASDSLHLPVLRELFERIAIPSQLEHLDVRTPIEWAEATLRRTDWAAFAATFDITDHGDAVNYFYEPFLEAFDPALREQLGVWYTPREIIRYQVARVDRLLREELGVAAGLADPNVVVLDPATGTGGYLLEVLRVIDATLRERGAGAMRGNELRTAARERVSGFEILPAPFVVAHLQIATLLAGLGAPLGRGQRAGVYLTNSLIGWRTEADERPKQLGLGPEYPALKAEAEAAASVKHSNKILVILGNPPYNAFAGVAEAEEKDLLAPYYVGLKEQYGLQARSINDLYVRFFRLAERQIAERTGRGVVSFISNYSWLRGLSHPIMREHILRAFDTLWVDNLHGDRIISERTPNGNSCETIFAVRGQGAGIKVGTAITTMLKTGKDELGNMGAHSPDVFYRDVWGMPDDQATWGRAERKRAALVWSGGLDSKELANLYRPIAPTQATRYTLAPGGAESDYLTWPALTDIFVRSYPGVKTSRDADLVSIERAPLEARMRAYFDPNLSDAQVAEVAPTLMSDASRYDAHKTRQELLKISGYQDDRLVRVAYRPLDDRWLYWEPTTKLLDEKRADFFEQVFDGNLFIAASTRGRRGDVNLPMITDKFSSLHLQDPYSLYFPLYLQHAEQDRTGLLGPAITAMPQLNIAPKTLDLLMARYEAAESEREELGVALFHHILAVTRAPAYQQENAGYLMQDWPRIPIPATRETLLASAALGRRVADLLRPDVPFTAEPHLRRLGEPTRINGAQLDENSDLALTIRYNGVGRYEPPIPNAVSGGHEGRLWWNDVGYWANVPFSVWAFTIGGYPVIKKWLDYRHESKLGRPLRPAEVRYVSEMIQRIASLLGLGAALDGNYATAKSEVGS